MFSGSISPGLSGLERNLLFGPCCIREDISWLQTLKRMCAPTQDCSSTEIIHFKLELSSVSWSVHSFFLTKYQTIDLVASKVFLSDRFILVFQYYGALLHLHWHLLLRAPVNNYQQIQLNDSLGISSRSLNCLICHEIMRGQALLLSLWQWGLCIKMWVFHKK